MEYIISLSSQAKGFLFSMGFGMTVGVLYDIIRVIRLCFFKSKAALVFFDVAYILISSVASFLFMLTVTDGQLRLFIAVGELIGFLVYYFTFGIVAVRFSAELADKIKRKLSKFFTFLFSPIFKILRPILLKISVFSKKMNKKSKKLTKNVNFLLHLGSSMYYNLTDKRRIVLKDSVREKAKGNMNTRTRTRKTKKYSFFLMIGLLAFVGYFVVSFIGYRMQIKAKNTQLASLNATYDSQLVENDKLQKVADGENKDEYVEKVAREKLGYVKPGEKVYYNVTPSN